MTNKSTDDRLKKSDELAVDLVGRPEDRNAQDRRAQDRAVTEDRDLTEADRLQMFRERLFNDALPDLPHLPGYHVCWLTTNNNRDPVHKRLQLGYELIRADEIPGMEYSSLKTGEYAGCVGMNEMVAAKIPSTLYQAFMQEVHHRQPLEEEEKIRQAIEAAQEQAKLSGAALIPDEGFSEMLQQQTPVRGLFS